MNKRQLQNLINLNDEIIEYIENNKNNKAYAKMADVSKLIQRIVLELLEYEILDNNVVIMLLRDLVESMEQRDNVLLVDTLKYGINALLQEIVAVIEEGENNE